MRRPTALGALVLAVGVIAPGVSADAQQAPTPVTTPAGGAAARPLATPDPARPRTLLPLPEAGRPAPMPHARPRGLPPVAIPHVRPQRPGPVPMPLVGEPVVPELRLQPR